MSAASSDTFHVRSPGRVNLIGDHTDYTGGLVFPMAIDRGIDLVFRRIPGRIEARSDAETGIVSFDLPMASPEAVSPRWGRYIAAVASLMEVSSGFAGHLTSTIPSGAGLSSSAALEVAAAVALGHPGPAAELAALCRRAEFLASGVPCGIMDQLSIAAGVEGSALIIDCTSLDVTPVQLPDGIDVVVKFIAHRTLEGSEYGERVAQCSAAEAVIGSLATARLDELASIDDPLVRRRARHVISENQRVRDFGAALAAGDLDGAGALMIDSHHSLATDFSTSTAVMDAAVADWSSRPGVYGARMTGGGFGGCIVALADHGAVDPADAWIVRPSAGARYL